MNSLLHMTAVILIILWAIGIFALSAGPVIHILLVMAGVTILLQTVRENREFER